MLTLTLAPQPQGPLGIQRDRGEISLSLASFLGVVDFGGLLFCFLLKRLFFIITIGQIVNLLSVFLHLAIDKVKNVVEVARRWKLDAMAACNPYGCQHKFRKIEILARICVVHQIDVYPNELRF